MNSKNFYYAREEGDDKSQTYEKNHKIHYDNYEKDSRKVELKTQKKSYDDSDGEDKNEKSYRIAPSRYPPQG